MGGVTAIADKRVTIPTPASEGHSRVGCATRPESESFFFSDLFRRASSESEQTAVLSTPQMGTRSPFFHRRQGIFGISALSTNRLNCVCSAHSEDICRLFCLVSSFCSDNHIRLSRFRLAGTKCGLLRRSDLRLFASHAGGLRGKVGPPSSSQAAGPYVTLPDIIPLPYAKPSQLLTFRIKILSSLRKISVRTISNPASDASRPIFSGDVVSLAIQPLGAFSGSRSTTTTVASVFRLGITFFRRATGCAR